MSLVTFLWGVVVGLAAGWIGSNSSDKRLRQAIADTIKTQGELFYQRIRDDMIALLRQELGNLRAIDDGTSTIAKAPPPPRLKPQPFVNDISRILNFLERRNIAIKTIPEINRQIRDADQLLDRIATQMGDRYPSIRKLYEQIKSNMNLGQRFSICLREEPQINISNICQLGKALHEIGFLEEYNYRRAPHYLLSTKPSRMPEALNFFAGQWLERYVRSKFLTLVSNGCPPADYAFLANPQIVLPNGDDFELDLLLEIGGQIYWFEAKTGDYQRHVEKYGRIRPILGIDCQRAFMVLLDVRADIAQALTDLHGLSVINIDQVEQTLATLIQPSRQSP